MFLAVVMTPFCSDAYISGNRLPVPADEEEETQDVIIPESFAESEDRKNSDFEAEEELLHRWGLDSEDFPSLNREGDIIECRDRVSVDLELLGDLFQFNHKTPP